MRGKTKWRAKSDPPPDLAVEMDVTHSSLDRMAIYAALKVPEVWRCTRKSLRAFCLGSDGLYHAGDTSALLPFVPLDEIYRFLQMSAREDETTLLRHFVAWVRADVLRRYQVWKQRNKKNGK
jgi:hypothetical protein